jgi:hypothetical protein
MPINRYNAECPEASAQKASAPILPRLLSGRRTKSIPLPQLICPELGGRPPAHTHIFRRSEFSQSSYACGD